MKDLKITKGEYVIIGTNDTLQIRSELEMAYYICQSWGKGERHVNNLTLFADAGNTAQKCGLLPSELLQQRDELLEALKSARLQSSIPRLFEIIEAAITKAEER